MGGKRSPLEAAVYEDALLKQLKDPTLEEQLIGNFIAFSGYGFAEVANILDATDFANRNMGIIYKACLELYKKGNEINLALIYAELQRMGINSVTAADLAKYAMVERSMPGELALHVKDASQRRKLSDAFARAMYEVIELDKDVADVTERVRKLIDDLNTEVNKNFVAIGEPMVQLMADVYKRADGGVVEGIKAGFRIIDEKGGLQLSDLNIVAGDTSSGKTSLAMCMIKNVATSGVPCAVYSMEMSALQLSARLLAVESVDLNDGSCVSGSDILYTALDYNDYSRVHHCFMQIKGLPIYIDSRASHSIEQLAANIRSMCHATGAKVVMIDYIQLIGCKQSTDEVRCMDIIARELKVVAADLNICIIALSQLNRPKEGVSPVPTLRRLRNSGGIEQAADNIYLIYRAEIYERKYPGGWSGYPTQNTALLFRAKGRSVGLAERLLTFVPKATAYFDYQSTTTGPKALGSDLPSQMSIGEADWMQ